MYLTFKLIKSVKFNKISLMCNFFQIKKHHQLHKLIIEISM